MPHCPPRIRAAVACAATALTVFLAGPAAAQQDAADVERLVDALQIRLGMRVAEIGAGNGSLTVALAKAVGPDGYVYSNEISADRRRAIGTAVRDAGLDNVTVIESGAADANLPAACCDALFMRNVYHHFDDPAAMNDSLFRALRPGARIAIIDFPPRGGHEAREADDRDQGNAHGVTTDTVERELQAAGFTVVTTDHARGSRWFMVVAQKPAAGR